MKFSKEEKTRYLKAQELLRKKAESWPTKELLGKSLMGLPGTDAEIEKAQKSMAAACDHLAIQPFYQFYKLAEKADYKNEKIKEFLDEVEKINSPEEVLKLYAKMLGIAA